MSLHMNAQMARLSVLGTGWGNSSVISGDGFTIDGQLWEDIGTILEYDWGPETDWDIIAEDQPPIDWPQIIYTLPDPDDTWTNPDTGIEYPTGGYPVYEIDDIIYTDPDGDGYYTDPFTGIPMPELPEGLDPIYTPDPLVFTDPDGDGIWTDPDTGLEYPGGGDLWMPEDMICDFADGMGDIAVSDNRYFQYNIPQEVINQIKGGPISMEQQSPSAFGQNGPHYYEPYCYVIQLSQTLSVIFNSFVFHHRHTTGEFDIDTTTIVIRDGSSKTVYYGDCNTHNFNTLVPSPYKSYPKAYICWQCLYGPFEKHLISVTENTITSDVIRQGTSGLDTMTIGGTEYYRVS